jgi:hypothetical protein
MFGDRDLCACPFDFIKYLQAVRLELRCADAAMLL